MINSLYTYGFRNLEDTNIDVGFKEVFFIGNNGQGKSNLLEVLYYMSYASSFRGAKDGNILKKGYDAFSVIGKFNDYDVLNLKFESQKKEKSIVLNSNKLNNRKELMYYNPSIVFCHDDFLYIKGNPEKKRLFFDQTLGLYNADYIDKLQSFKKILQFRNYYLKENALNDLSIVNLKFAELVLYLNKARLEFLEDFKIVFKKVFSEISHIDEIDIDYSPSIKFLDINEILKFLEEKQEGDILYGTCRYGSHKDNYRFLFQGLDFSDTASTGQIRLASLALKIAQAEFFRKKTNKDPTLLLDDVLLELDGQKKIDFFELIPPYRQAFFTFLPDEPYQKYIKPSTKVYNVDCGRIF